MAAKKPKRLDFLSPQERSARMALIKSGGTKPELFMSNLLKRAGLKHRCRLTTLPGKPDFTLACAHVTVFIDGEFWHGKDFADWQHKLSSYWLKKIGRNMDRDRTTNHLLRAAGWSVIRIWESDLYKRPEWCMLRIRRAIRRRS